MKLKAALLIAIVTVVAFARTANAISIPCVSEICGGYSSRMRGVNIAPSSSSFVLGQVRQSYPWAYQPLFPFSYPGAYEYWSRVILYRYF